MLRDNGENADRFGRDRWDIPVAVVGTATFVLLYVLMMDLVLHNWTRVACLGTGVLLGGTFLYSMWWRKLSVEYDGETR